MEWILNPVDGIDGIEGIEGPVQPVCPPFNHPGCPPWDCGCIMNVYNNG